jgi:hypothetical protein
MGEIADDIVEGRCCSLCGQYFQDPDDEDSIHTHGYPVVCKDCWKGLTKDEKNSGDYQRALADTL